jgi:multidrug resistance efflux pump
MVARQQDKDTTTTRVYKYGLVPIDAFPKEAIYELKRANQLWNRLVALHHNHFEELEQARCNADSAYAQEKTKLAEV